MKLVYICSPFSGDTAKNIENAKEFCRFAIENECAPIAAHLLYPQILDDSIPADRQAGIMLGLKLLSVCDEMWVFGNEFSEGMKIEIQTAKALKIPVWYVENQLK